MSDYNVTLMDDSPADVFVIFHGPKDSTPPLPCHPCARAREKEASRPHTLLPCYQACTPAARGRCTSSFPRATRTTPPPSASATASSTRMSTRCEPRRLACFRCFVFGSPKAHSFLVPAGRGPCAWTSSTRPGLPCSVQLAAPPDPVAPAQGASASSPVESPTPRAS